MSGCRCTIVFRRIQCPTRTLVHSTPTLIDLWLIRQLDTSSRDITQHLDPMKRAQREDMRELERELKTAELEEDEKEIRHLQARIKDREAIHELQLDREIQKFEHENSLEKERQSRVSRDFARWSTTADGQTFLEWATAVDGFHGLVNQFTGPWYRAYRNEARRLVTVEEQQQYDDQRWIDRPRFSRLFWTLITIAGLAFALAALLALILSDYGMQQLEPLMPVIPMLFFGSLVVAAIVGFKDKTARSWRDENHAVGTAAARARINRFGFDPCDESSTPPSIWRGDADEESKLLLEAVLDGIERHPAASALPTLSLPTLKTPDEIPFPPMQDMLAGTRKKIEDKMPQIL